MIRKSGYRFSEKIMLKQQAKAKCRFNLNSFRFSVRNPEQIWFAPPMCGADRSGFVRIASSNSGTSSLRGAEATKQSRSHWIASLRCQ
jgi:hypothetical protein